MGFDLEAALLRLKDDFIATSLDKLDHVDQIIDAFYQGQNGTEDQYFQLQRDIHSIKGSAGTHGLSTLTLVAHRLEDYLESSSSASANKWQDIQAFCDEMRKLVELGAEPDATVREETLKRLPSIVDDKTTAISEQKKRHVTILLVMPQGVQRKVIAKELTDCGFDLSYATRPLEAVSLVMNINPDAVLSNQEFPHMTGLELAHVLKAIEATRETPFALLTSSDIPKDTLPQETQLIKKGGNFMSELTDYLLDVGLFGRLSVK